MNMKTTLKLMLLALSLIVSSVQASQVEAEVVVFYHNDMLGSAVATTDANGNLCWVEDYKPYGDKRLNQDNGCGIDNNQRGYTGHVHDKDIGLTYMQARYYDPVVGRFMGIDPVGVVLGNQVSFNRYAYGGNNPYKFVDPDGEASVLGVFGRLGFGYATATVAERAVMNAMADIALGLMYGKVIDDVVISPMFSEEGEAEHLPDKIFDRKAPKQREPTDTEEEIDHSRFNPKTGKLEESKVKYDKYGRQIERTDYSDHGYPDDHTNPHTHDTEYGVGTEAGHTTTREDNNSDVNSEN